MKELTEKVYEIAESSQSSKASDLDELNLLVGKLSDVSFAINFLFNIKSLQKKLCISESLKIL